MPDNQIAHPVLKVTSLWAAWLAGVSWGERASMLACAYSVLLIIDWTWKKLGKPLAIRKGWMKGKPRYFMDSTGHGDIEL